MEMLTLESRFCGACEYWLGGRMVDESGRVCVLPESGVCLHGGAEAEICGFCEQWVAWRFSEDCFWRAAVAEEWRIPDDLCV